MITELDGERSALATSLQAALLNTARWDLDTRPVTQPLLDRLLEQACRGEKLDPQLHANLAIELAAAGTDRDRAVSHAREALRATPRLMSVTSTALPETVSVLLFADLSDEARQAAQAWLRLAQERGWPLSSAVAASVASLTALYRGEVSQAAAYGQQAMEGTGDVWISSIAAAFLVHALTDRGAHEEARAVLAARNLAAELLPTWPYVVVRYARGCLRAASGEHAAAAEDSAEGRPAGRALGRLQPGHDGLALDRRPVAGRPRRRAGGRPAVRRGGRAGPPLGQPPRARDRTARGRRGQRGRPRDRVADRGGGRPPPVIRAAGAGPRPDRSRRGAPPGRPPHPGPRAAARGPARRRTRWAVPRSPARPAASSWWPAAGPAGMRCAAATRSPRAS